MLKSYPKILPLVGKYADLVVDRTVEVTEKIDGSMFAFGLDENGKLHCRSKGQAIDPEYPNDMFRPAVEYVRSIEHKLAKGTSYYGETLKTPRHNTLAYDRVPHNHIALFGVFDFDRTRGSDYDTVRRTADELGVESVRLLGNVNLSSLVEFADLMKSVGVSQLGGANIEGIVIKDYTRPMDFAGMIYPLTVLKYVSEEFKEKHANNPDWVGKKDALELLYDSYRTEARWQKAVQHLRDEGKLLGEPKDIGPLMAEIWRDLVEEEKQNFMEELFKLYKKRWASRAQAGFPEWYKTRLLEGNL